MDLDELDSLNRQEWELTVIWLDNGYVCFFHITSSPSSSCLFNKRWLFKPAVKPRQIHLLKQATTMCWLQGLTVDFAVHHNLSKSGSPRPTFFHGGFVHTGNVRLCPCLRCICTQWLTSAASDSFSEPNMTRALKMDEDAVESHIRLILLTDETFGAIMKTQSNLYRGETGNSYGQEHTCSISAPSIRQGCSRSILENVSVTLFRFFPINCNKCINRHTCHDLTVCQGRNNNMQLPFHAFSPTSLDP